MSSETRLITIEQVKQLTAVTQNVDPITIRPHLLTTQMLKMMPLLGKQLIDQLIGELETERIVSAATQANPVVITTSLAHGYTTADSIYIASATGMTDINGQWTITVLSPTTFELDGLDGTGFAAYNVGTATSMDMIAADVALMPYVRNVMAWHVLAYAVPFIWATITNSGIITHGQNRDGMGGVGSPVAASDMKWFKQNCENTANAHEQILYEFMDTNSDDYPLWRPACTFTALGNCPSIGGGTGINGPVNRKSGLNIRFA
jgi:hypothetical protein